MKQKDVLENNLKLEREDRHILENSVNELRRKLAKLQDGSDNVKDLRKSMGSQIYHFDDLKRVITRFFDYAI